MNEQQQARRIFTFVVDPFDLEVTVVAATEKEARQSLWAHHLSNAAKDGCESIDLVEERLAA